MTIVDSGPGACGKDSSGNPVPGFGEEVAQGPHRCFLDQSARVDQAKIPYDHASTNSNAYVYTILHNCGITSRAPTGGSHDPTGEKSAPGWGRLLI
jgi:hypothetical protein